MRGSCQALGVIEAKNVVRENTAMEMLLKELEAYRERNGLSKTAMAEIFGLSGYQVYKSWIDRNSVPKDYIEDARSLVKSDTEEGLLSQQLIKEVEGMSARELRQILVEIHKIRRSRSRDE